MSRIKNTFNRLKKRNEKALIPYLMAGDPDIAATKQLVLALLWVHELGQRVGVNGLEVLGRRRLAQRIAQRVKQVDGHVDLQACGVRAAANTWEVRTPWTEDRR